MKFIFVSGGVISGLGKGITSASLALLLKSRGYTVAPVKIDMYLNVDAGTIRPLEHGETFVTTDGLEADEDLGHYERYLNENMSRANYITTGQIYQEVIRKERALEYEGEDVEAVPHVTDEIIRRIKEAGKEKRADIVLVELGGTVGEYQNGIFFEASRILTLKNPGDVGHIHVTYLPLIASLGELKSKPAQTSVHILNGMGIHPDILVARSEKPIDTRRLARLALFTSVRPENIFGAPDVESVYEIPLLLNNSQQTIDEAVLKILGLKIAKANLKDWQGFVTRSKQPNLKTVEIAIAAKYYKSGEFNLADSYVCVTEAIKHAGINLGLKPKLRWINTDDLENKTDQEVTRLFSGISGLIVPQGWGSRGVEGKIRAIQYARENKLPYLGLCFGMQMAVIEFARNVLGMKGANTTEADPKTKFPVVHIMPDQAAYLAKKQYGGTIRLGQWPTKISPKGKQLAKSYKKYAQFAKEYVVGKTILERHRHRYEFNNAFRARLEKAGLIISGESPDGKLVEAIEIANHPFFVATQYHPELQSRPLSPHPLFLNFLEQSETKLAKSI